VDNTTTEESAGHIAIIGMAGHFPGANNIDEFWDNLKNGVESITFFSDEELLAAGIEPELLKQPNYVKAKGALDDVAGFDAAFFGFTPKEAEITDPQQRLFLECAWTALEDAGYDPKTYAGEIGVYGSVGGVYTYLAKNLSTNPKIIETVGDYAIMLGNDKDFLCTRVAYKLNLSGPAVTVQTACSSSLVAVVMGSQSLLHYQSDMVLAGGAAISMPAKAGYLYQEGMILSPDGHCRAFDAKAKGTVIGNGAGMVVLKRLEEALTDGDHIYAVIKGSFMNNDGTAKMNYTAPSVEGQAKVIEEALAIADIDPETITYVEAHGTGTPLGDPIEIAALTQAFNTEQKGYCAIGSVKTNLGHLDSAAGITNLITAVLALKHQLIPPSLHFDTPNPEIDFANSPFYVNTQLTEWQTDGFPRRAGVSAFGVGGTNAHVVLEEAPNLKLQNSKYKSNWQLLVLSAKTESALETATSQLLEHLQQHPDLNLADVAYTYQVGRQAFNHRRMLVGKTIDEIVNFKPLTYVTDLKKTPSVVFMFSGQGAQYVNMGLELYQTEPIFREHVDYCAEFLQSHLKLDLRAVLYPNPSQNENQQINQTAFSQPALFVIEYALAQLWMSWEIQPTAMIGHSIGEYVAACLAGVFTLNEALVLVTARGRLMQSMPSGTMLAVPLSEKEIRPLLNNNIDLAVINVPSQSVVSGPTEAALQFAAQLLAERGLECKSLHTSHAFHSAMMLPILPSFLKEVQKVSLQPPQMPYLSNVTGTWIKASDATDPNYWVKHLRQTVRFAAGLQPLVKESKHVLLEIGPGRTLSTYAKRHPDKVAGQVVLTSLRHPKDEQSDSGFLLNTLGQLWLAGVVVNWTDFYGDEQRRRLPLPTYPFDRQRYWIEPSKLVNENKLLSLSEKKDIADWFYIPSWQRSTLPRSFNSDNQILSRQCWLVFLDECGLGAKIVTRLEQASQDVITVSIGQAFTSHNDRSYTLNLEQPNDYDALLNALHSLNKIPTMIVHLWRVTANNFAESTLEHLDELQSLGFYSLLFLTQAIGKQNLTAKIQIAIVSNNMQAVIGEKWLCPEKATLLGAVKVIPQEYTNISCRSIDVILPDSDNEQQLIDQLWQELTSKFTDIVVAYRETYRWIPTFEPVRLEKTTEETPRLREQGVYLIIGGLGAIGLTLAEYLAKTVQAKLILVGRSAFPPKNEWEQWLATDDKKDSVGSKIRKLQAFENWGAEVFIFSADVANQTQMQNVITQSEKQFGQKINGVINTAGVIDYAGVIQKRTRAMTESTMISKLKGTLVLDNLLQNVKPDFLVLGSSIGSVLYHAKFGQVGYAAASDFLDAFTYYKHWKDNTFTVTIDWSDWQEIGMSVEAEKHWRKTHNLTEEHSLLENTLLTIEGVEIFKRILTNTFSRVVVSKQDLLAMIEQDALTPTIPIKPLEEIKASQLTHPRPNLSNAYSPPQNERAHKLANLWQDFLGVDKVGIHDDFFELGGDSLLATQLIAKMNKAFQTQLSSASLLESSTIAKLVKLIEEIGLSSMQPSSLVRLQRGSGTKSSLFLVHSVGGQVFNYRELVHHLGAEQPVYGLQAQGLDGKTTPFTTIENMAAHYLEALRSVQANGPYFLGGHSFGGGVALEMAQQLQADNQTVALLVLIDSIGPDQIHQIPLKFEPGWETQILAFLIEEGSNFSVWLEQLRNFTTENEQIRYFLQQGKLNKTFPANFELADVHRVINIMKANFQAIWAYTPQVYAGRVVLFKAKERNAFNPDNSEISWAKMVNGELDVYEIPGNHLTMNFSPNVEVMAERMKTYLAGD